MKPQHHLCISVPNRYLGIGMYAEHDIFHIGLTPGGAWEVHVSDAHAALPVDQAEDVIRQAWPYVDACREITPPGVIVDDASSHPPGESVTDGAACGAQRRLE